MTSENDWTQEFGNKEISQLMDMTAPEELSEDDAESWQKAWSAAFRAKKAEQTPDLPPAADAEAARLLEKQMASSAALIEYLTKYVSSDRTDPHICMSFMDRMSNMLRASANVGKVVSQLRGQVSRSEQAIEVAYRGRGRG